jgi:hypothetical protein
MWAKGTSMSGKKSKTKFPGVRARKHPARKHGVRFDDCRFIRYRVDGRQIEKMYGWPSPKMTAQGTCQRMGEPKERCAVGILPGG